MTWSPHRRLVAVMFTDMVGYTALMQADERRAVDKRDQYVSALERQHDVCRRDDRAASRRREPLDVPERARGGQAAVAMQRELAAS